MRQLKEIVLVILLSVHSCILLAQYTGLNMSIRSAFQGLEYGDKIEVNLYSDAGEFPDVLNKEGIEFRRYFKNYYRIKVGKESLAFLSQCPLIKYSEIIQDRGYLLNDTMLSNNKILPLHNGALGSRQAYTGRNVVIGFIDTGIDFNHPDFQDSTAKTRVLKIWDQSADTLVNNRIPGFGYGQVWDSSDINSANCPHDDDVLSHGTNVAGIAAGNGLAINKYKGVAPESDIIYVATDFSSSDWLNTVADGVAYIFNEAEKLSRPCVINISAGTYLGSHDGSDLTALRIDSMIKAKNGRMVVAAAGNAGALKFHLGYNVTTDTNFTWFKYNPSSSLGYGSVYFQLWADTADLNQVDFSVGANRQAPSFQFRSSTQFDNIKQRLNVIKSDSLFAGQHLLGVVSTYAQLMGDKYLLEVNIAQPDSNQYLFSFRTTGNGRFDLWSDSWLGHSQMYNSTLPSVNQFPEIQFYKKPDSLQTIASSFTCLPSVISVGNYINRSTYVDVNNQVQIFPVTVGLKSVNSSFGPNRKGYLKPDVIASGDITLTANRLASIPLHIANNQSDRIAQGGKHKRNGGTSMAAPVVAGLSALLLEECTSLSASRLKAVILQNATTDSLTGASPNLGYGYGKVHGLSSLKALYYQTEIEPADDTLLCGSASLILSGPSSMNWYAWSFGDSTQSVTIDSTIVASLITQDSSGCLSIADTVSIQWFKSAEKPTVTSSNDTLIASKGNFYQWFLNGALLTGETSQRIYTSSNGSYSVEVWDANSCSALSDDYYVAVGLNQLIDDQNYVVSPNPTNNGAFRITCNYSNTLIHYELYDSNMNLMMSDYADNAKRIDVSHCANGLYFVKIVGEESIEMVKLIITN